MERISKSIEIFSTKVKNFIGNKKVNKIRAFLILLVILFGTMSLNLNVVKDFSAKIFLETNQIEKEFLDLKTFLEKIKSGDVKKIESVKKMYKIEFPVLGNIVNERVSSVGENIHFYFESTIGNGGSIHEFIYDGRFVDGKIISLVEVD